jgi:quinol monooxygenase YgiN
MIVVVGRVETDPEKRADLIRVAQTVAAASREEEGCIDYRFFADTEADDRFVFVEEWASEEALQQHFATSHIATFLRDIQGAIVSAPDVRFHTIASTKTLADVTAG